MSFTKKNIFIVALCVQISSVLMPAEETTPTPSKPDLNLMEIGAQGAVFNALYHDLLALTRNSLSALQAATSANQTTAIEGVIRAMTTTLEHHTPAARKERITAQMNECVDQFARKMKAIQQQTKSTN